MSLSRSSSITRDNLDDRLDSTGEWKRDGQGEQVVGQERHVPTEIYREPTGRGPLREDLSADDPGQL